MARTQTSRDYEDSDIVIGVHEEANVEPRLLKNRHGGSASIGRTTMEALARIFKDAGFNRTTGVMRVAVMGGKAIEEFGGNAIVFERDDEHDADEDFASRMLAATEGMRIFLTIEEVEGAWPGFQVVSVKRTAFRETKVILRTFLTRDGEMTVEKGVKAREYADTLCEFFGLELR